MLALGDDGWIGGQAWTLEIGVVAVVIVVVIVVEMVSEHAFSPERRIESNKKAGIGTVYSYTYVMNADSPPALQSSMPSTHINPLPCPFLPTHPQIHSQARYHFLFLPPPFGPPKQPVCQCHHSSCSVYAIVLICVLNGMCCDASFGIKGKYEHA